MPPTSQPSSSLLFSDICHTTQRRPFNPRRPTLSLQTPSTSTSLSTPSSRLRQQQQFGAEGDLQSSVPSPDVGLDSSAFFTSPTSRHSSLPPLIHLPPLSSSRATALPLPLPNLLRQLPAQPQPQYPQQPQHPPQPLQPRPVTPQSPELHSDDFLELLAAGNFSSPSILGDNSGPTASCSRAAVAEPEAASAASATATLTPKTSSHSSMSRRSARMAATSTTAASPTLRTQLRSRRASSGNNNNNVSNNSGSSPNLMPGAFPVDPSAAYSSPPQSQSQSQTEPQSSLPQRSSVKRRRNSTALSGPASVSTSASASAVASTSASALGSGSSASGSSLSESQAQSESQSHMPNTRKRQRQAQRVGLRGSGGTVAGTSASHGLFISDDEDEGVELVNLTNIDRLEDDAKEDNTEGDDEKKAQAEAAARSALAASSKIKLSSIQCVICMDDVTGLTVTHCGHVFCGECLHASLYIDATRKICPICRQKIEVRTGGQPKARSYFPLELKLMTRNRQGKQPATQP